MSDKAEAALRKHALGYPDVKEEIACKGTKVESAVFRVKKKSFLFLGNGVLRLKLTSSLPEPTRYNAGAGGWIKVTYGPDQPLQLDVLKKWVEESYQG